MKISSRKYFNFYLIIISCFFIYCGNPTKSDPIPIPEAPELVKPADEDTLAGIEFTGFLWHSSMYGVKYQFHISTKPDLSDTLFKEVYSDTLIEKLSLPYGKYYWHVRAQNKVQLWSEWSSVFSFTFKSEGPWIPTGPLEHKRGMVKIMAKNYEFEMGQPNPDIWGKGTSEKEQPVHTVNFTYDFWMDTTEVTQADYDKLMKKTYTDYFKPVWPDDFGYGDKFPTYSVLWYDVALYCNARSKKDDYDTVYAYKSIVGSPGYLCSLAVLKINLSNDGYRLPTEAEWEYACRGGTTTNFYWGKNYDPYPSTAKDSTEIGKYSVWRVNSWDFFSGPEFGNHHVATKKPNNYGLYDMIGNGYEWCNDWDSQYKSGSVTDPTGSDSGTVHILRGGSWGNDASYLRSANRYDSYPEYEYYFVGFRVVRPVW